MFAPGRSPLVLACLFSLGACESPGQRAASVVHRDSAGVRITESFAPVWGDTAGWTVDPDPVIDLAESGTGPDHEFFNASDATRLSDGTFVVADDGEDEIRLFTAEGDYLRTLGRAGDGPGEFRRLSQVMALPGDSIWAFDYWQKRITVLGPDGGWRIVTLSSNHRSRPLFPLTRGGFVGLSADYAGYGDEPGPYRPPSPVIRLDSTGAQLDTLTVLPGAELVAFSRGDGQALWGKEPQLNVREGSVYMGSSDSLSYEVRRPDGRRLQIARVPGFDLTLSEQEKEAERTVPAPEEFQNNQLYHDVVRELQSLQPERTHRPAFSAMLVDALGHVWLGEFQGFHEEDETRDWFIFNPAGEWLGTVTLPPRFEVFRIGPDWILGKRPDELDVEHVQLLRLRRGG